MDKRTIITLGLVGLSFYHLYKQIQYTYHKRGWDVEDFLMAGHTETIRAKQAELAKYDPLLSSTPETQKANTIYIRLQRCSC